ncbi:MAG: hypothetical protein WA973_02765 [Mesorhizobium sp.]
MGTAIASTERLVTAKERDSTVEGWVRAFSSDDCGRNDDVRRFQGPAQHPGRR